MAKIRVRTYKSKGVLNVQLALLEQAPTTQRLEAGEAQAVDDALITVDIQPETFGRRAPIESVISTAMGLLNTREHGDGGADYQSGVNDMRDRKAAYRPYLGRGLRSDYGLYHQILLDEIQVLRPWTDISGALRSGDWYVEAPDEARKPIAQDLQRALFDVAGGWGTFVQNAFYAWVSGFVLFEEVFTLDGLTLDKLAFRPPKQVLEWVLDADGRALVAVRLSRGGAAYGSDYYLPASATLVISVNAIGDDHEGISPLRPIVKYSLAKDLLSRLEALAAEKWGRGVFVLSQEAGSPAADEDETSLFARIVDALSSEDGAIIELPDGKKFELISPQGVMPDFTALKRYCDEQIAMALQGEGNLLGMQGNGSRALAEVADNRALRAAPAYAKLICDAINGSKDTPWQGTLRKLQRLRHGAPEDGRWCELRYSLDRNGRDSTWFGQVGTARQTGLLGEWTDDDIGQMRKELQLAPLPPKPPEAPPVAGGGGADLQESAMNGAQIASLVDVVAAVGDGRLPRESAIAIVKRGFNVSQQAAEEIVGPERAPAPAAPVAPGGAA